MNEFLSPWFNFPIPSDPVLHSDLELARVNNNMTEYASLLLIAKLRSFGDYTQYLPDVQTDQLSQVELELMLANSTKLTDPNFYLKKGSVTKNLSLFQGIQTTNIQELSELDLPPIRYKVSSLAGRDTIFSLIPDINNQLQLLYWLTKTKILDTSSKRLSALGDNIFATKSNISREILAQIDESLVNLRDIPAIEEARERVMFRSEEDYVRAVLHDRFGFMHPLGGISNPDKTDMLSYAAQATDNRRQFMAVDVPEYIVNIGTKDFINFRFELVSYSGEDILEVQWSFPQAEHTRTLSGCEAWDTPDVIKLYAKSRI